MWGTTESIQSSQKCFQQFCHYLFGTESKEPGETQKDIKFKKSVGSEAQIQSKNLDNEPEEKQELSFFFWGSVLTSFVQLLERREEMLMKILYPYSSLLILGLLLLCTSVGSAKSCHFLLPGDKDESNYIK